MTVTSGSGLGGGPLRNIYQQEFLRFLSGGVGAAKSLLPRPHFRFNVSHVSSAIIPDPNGISPTSGHLFFGVFLRCFCGANAVRGWVLARGVSVVF